MVLLRDELTNRFTVWDYVVFGAMLLLSAVIGLYYACSGGKQRTASEFLLGSRQMGVLPVAFSLLASFMSAITLLGNAAEMYVFDASFWLIGFAYSVVVILSAYIYLPIFYSLEITSAYEYLERRFSKHIRRCGSFFFTLQMTIYMAIVLYAPALALSQVTGIHVWSSVAAIGVVCTFYTTLGGMKAVMWTDTLQIVIIFGAMLTVLIKGCADVGGIEVVWEKGIEGKRLQLFDFSPDPLIRHSFWSLTIGGTFTWLAIYGVNQSQVQRYLTTPTIKAAQKALWWNLFGLLLLLSICQMLGLVMYAAYWNCDPLMSKQIAKSDQLVPLFVMETLGGFPGIPGLFVAGIFSGSLSTLSSGMNSLAAVALEDFIKPCCARNITDTRAAVITKIIAFLYGVICIALVVIVERLGSVLEAALQLFGIVGGPLLGVFSLGMFFPCANSYGAAAGLLSAFAIVIWIATGSQMYKNLIHHPKGVVSIAGCKWENGSLMMNETFNDFLSTTTSNSVYNNSFTTLALNETEVPEGFLEIFKLSYLNYSVLAVFTVIIVGLIISLITGGQDVESLDPRLLYPLFEKLCCCCPGKIRKMFCCVKKKSSSNDAVIMEDLKNGKIYNQKGIVNPSFKAEDHVTSKYKDEYITPL